MNVQEKIIRAKHIAQMMETTGYRKYFEPELNRIIEENSNIKTLNPEELEKSYLSQKIKVDVYRGILSKLDNWVKNAQKLLKEEQNG
jgi:hypothetical protein